MTWNAGPVESRPKEMERTVKNPGPEARKVPQLTAPVRDVHATQHGNALPGISNYDFPKEIGFKAVVGSTFSKQTFPLHSFLPRLRRAPLRFLLLLSHRLFGKLGHTRLLVLPCKDRTERRLFELPQ